jgi:hypothetical protein
MKKERGVVSRFMGGCFVVARGGSRQERGKVEKKRKKKRQKRNDN